MTDLKFNIYGFTKPTNKAEYIALLEEALRIQSELSCQIDTFERDLIQQSEAVPA